MIIYAKLCVILTIDFIEDFLNFLYRYLRKLTTHPGRHVYWWIKFSWANFVESLPSDFEFWPPVSGEI